MPSAMFLFGLNSHGRGTIALLDGHLEKTGVMIVRRVTADNHLYGVAVTSDKPISEGLGHQVAQLHTPPLEVLGYGTFPEDDGYLAQAEVNSWLATYAAPLLRR